MGTTYLIARVSTRQQKLERQIVSLKEYCPTGVVVADKYTGTVDAFERPEFSKVLKKAKAGDIFVFDEINRMSRREDGFDLYESLYNKGIDIVFLKQHHLDTENFRNALKQQIELTGNEIADIYIEATNKVLMLLAKQQIELAFEQAASEAEGIRRRVSEGLAIAKVNGKQVGREKGSTYVTKKSLEIKKIICEKSKDFEGTYSDRDILKLLKGSDLSCTEKTYYKYKRELREVIA